MMQYSLFNQLCIDKHKENWKVKIRISRMWNAINSKNNDIISLDMILIDEQVCFSSITFNVVLIIIYARNSIYMKLMHFTCRIIQYMQSFEIILLKSSSLFCKKENFMNSLIFKWLMAMHCIDQ